MKCKLCNKNINQMQERNRSRCNSCNTRIRRYRIKEAAVKLLGGRCIECGFVGPHVCFDFHHTSGVKDFTIGDVGNKAWKVIKKELKKCILLCSNCHRLKHSNRQDSKLLEEVKNYKGKLYI